MRAAATAASMGTPAAASAPDIPTDDTAAPPPGIGTSEASVPMTMLSDVNPQKLTDAPNALMQAMYTKAYSSDEMMLPPSINATRRGDRSAPQKVDAALLAGAATARLTLGIPNTNPITTMTTRIPIRAMSANLLVSMRAA